MILHSHFGRCSNPQAGKETALRCLIISKGKVAEIPAESSSKTVLCNSVEELSLVRPGATF